ncbi:hypothetical protein D9M72_615550 [compost metagenome]
MPAAWKAYWVRAYMVGTRAREWMMKGSLPNSASRMLARAAKGESQLTASTMRSRWRKVTLALVGSSTGKRTRATSNECSSIRRSKSLVVDSSITKSTAGYCWR